MAGTRGGGRAEPSLVGQGGGKLDLGQKGGGSMSAEMSFDHHSATEIPHAVSQAISSWQRTMSNARPAAASMIYREAARELRGLAKSDPTIDSLVEQSLSDMAESAGIDVKA